MILPTVAKLNWRSRAIFPFFFVVVCGPLADADAVPKEATSKLEHMSTSNHNIESSGHPSLFLSLSLSLSLFLLIFRSFSSFFFLILKENDFFFTRYRGRRGGGKQKKKKENKNTRVVTTAGANEINIYDVSSQQIQKKNENIFHGRAESRKMRDPRTRVEAAWLINKQIVAKKRRRRKARERWSWVDLKKKSKRKRKKSQK